MAEQIKATIIAHSKSSVNGKEIITWELEYPRFIHSEIMTHRLFSRNAASSRAIPVAKMIEQVRTNPATPVHWGKNQPGMQAKEELIGCDLDATQSDWNTAAKAASSIASRMSEYGAHKQIVNRILEPFQMMKTVLTATEFDNWFWLRKHPDAQPEIKMLAEKMWDAVNKSKAIALLPSQWHVPYYMSGQWKAESTNRTSNGPVPVDINGVSLGDALAISSSCCAQVSYRLLDDSLEKARKVYTRLVESEPVHASPFEHQATPIDYPYAVDTTELSGVDGATHIDREGNVWSGNFKSWVQYRQLIKNNACWDYKE